VAYTLSVEAEEDVIGIFLSGAEQFGLARAEHYHDELEKIFDLVALHPQAARIREELTPSVRVHPHSSHIIIYTVTKNNDVFIIRVRHAHEDWINQEK
jgi:toxin ParE1/3/4